MADQSGEATARQLAALNDQIKLLVKTEQRLHRSQNALHRQLTQVERLGQTALRWDGRSSPGTILADAVALLGRLYAVERVRAAVPDGSDLCAEGPSPACPVTVVPGHVIEAALQSVAHPFLTSNSEPCASLRSLLDAVGVFAADEPHTATAVVLPIRFDTALAPACLVASIAPGARPGTRAQVSADALPFLRLLAAHVSHALRNATLHAAIAHAQQDLLRAQAELEQRVDARTRELTAEVAERKRTEQQLILARDEAEAASNAKSAFLANMSHELRTPLNAIIGYAELIRDEAAAVEHPGIDSDCGRILIASRHLLHLINDVLDLSKIGAGKLTLKADRFDVMALMAEVLSTTRPLAAANGNQVIFAEAEGPVVMVGDRTRVAQVLLNLVGNAAKFTHGGTIGIRVDHDADGPGARVRIQVEDSGIGMTPDEVERLFTAFSQGDSSTTRRYGGTGLGLAISQSLCRLMGGHIGVTSEPGRGSCFTVTLPVVMQSDDNPL